jgi:hypothetical protein
MLWPLKLRNRHKYITPKNVETKETKVIRRESFRHTILHSYTQKNTYFQNSTFLYSLQKGRTAIC